MGMLPFLAKQSTDTTGTASIALNPAPSKARGFAAALGAISIKTRYLISWDAGYEIGIGTFDGGTPGGIARDQPLVTSNANALVALPAGTKDVYAWLDPHARAVLPLNAGTTLTLADLGNLVLFTGASDSTIGLPPYASVPLGSEYEIANDAPAFLTIDPNAAETVNGLGSYRMFPGDHVRLYRVATGWLLVRLNAERIGDLKPFASDEVQPGWYPLGAQALSRSTFAKLFKVTGTRFGAGDGSTTFNAPDGRGRAIIGMDNLGGAAAGRVTGNSGVAATSVGAAGGHELLFSHGHGVADPGHGHGVNDPGHVHALDRNVFQFGGGFNVQGGSGTSMESALPGTTGAGTGISIQGSFTGVSVQAAGGGNAQNMPPFLAVPWLIYAGA